jgi:hypothetical protein
MPVVTEETMASLWDGYDFDDLTGDIAEDDEGAEADGAAEIALAAEPGAEVERGAELRLADAPSAAIAIVPTPPPTTAPPTAPPLRAAPPRGGPTAQPSAQPRAAPPAFAVTGVDSILHADDGTEVDPRTPADWDAWVSAGRTRSHALDDPILDWLDRFGVEHGFQRDDAADGYDSRTDHVKFILERGQAFEDAVMALIRKGFGDDAVVTIRNLPEDTRDLAKARQTFEAMRDGTPFIAQAVLRNPQRQTYGAVDLLVRSDVVAQLVPGALTEEELLWPAPALARPGSAAPRWHYRAVDVKFHTLKVLKDGHVSGDSGTLPYHLQVWLYNEALGRLQGYLPPAAFILGRAWEQGKERGTRCFDRLARIDQDRMRRSAGKSIAELAEEAVLWVRRMRAEGSTWQALPLPSVPELYPHMRNMRDQPWHGAKALIASEVAELTLLPGMKPALRRNLHARGIRRWDDPLADARDFGIAKDSYAGQCAAVLEANRPVSPGTPAPVLYPTDAITHADQAWRAALPLELYVDFETVSNLADDFTRLPEIGGQPLIFQIGCGRWASDPADPTGTPRWDFAQWTVDALTHAE